MLITSSSAVAASHFRCSFSFSPEFCSVTVRFSPSRRPAAPAQRCAALPLHACPIFGPCPLYSSSCPLRVRPMPAPCPLHVYTRRPPLPVPSRPMSAPCPLHVRCARTLHASLSLAQPEQQSGCAVLVLFFEPRCPLHPLSPSVRRIPLPAASALFPCPLRRLSSVVKQTHAYHIQVGCGLLAACSQPVRGLSAACQRPVRGLSADKPCLLGRIFRVPSSSVSVSSALSACPRTPPQTTPWPLGRLRPLSSPVRSFNLSAACPRPVRRQPVAVRPPALHAHAALALPAARLCRPGRARRPRHS